MKKIKHMIFCAFLFSLITAPVLAQKRLIFMDGYLGWHYSLPAYLIANHATLKERPFSGFSVVGNVFTSYTMSADTNSNNVTYERVWNEVGGLKGLYQNKTDNFLRINLDFPGDFWDDSAWQITTRNFSAVAKAAKNLGFKGILFDDEVYASGKHQQANFMSNFKFPKKADVILHPENYAPWEIAESKSNRGDWMDYSCTINRVKQVDSENCAYRNPDYSFIEHMDKVASRFKTIMESMQNEFPEITLLVLHGAATAHPNTNVGDHYIKPNSVFESNEYKGAMFLGFKQGLNETASLHDMGEFYQYNTTAHFENAYQWRKHDITSSKFNQDLNNTYRWVIPVSDRASWAEDVDIGFMVSDYGLKHSRKEYSIQNSCQPADVESRLTKALERSDQYVIYYSDSSLSICDEDIRWADTASTVEAKWLDMMKNIYSNIQANPAGIIPVIMPLLLNPDSLL